MSQAKHTPGPWKASPPDGSYHDVIRIYSATNESRPVAVCPQMDTPLDSILKEQTDETTEAAANARLIAAAPDLLEACRGFVAKVDRGEARSRKSYAQMKAAIAKAEGRTS